MKDEILEMEVSRRSLPSFFFHLSSFLLCAFVVAIGVSDVFALTEKQKKKIDAWAEKSKLDQAQSFLQGLIKADPFDAEAHCRLGEVFQSQGQSEPALAEFKSAISIDPFCYDAYYPLWEEQWNKAKGDTEKDAIRSDIASQLEAMLSGQALTDKLYALAFFTYDMLKDRAKRDAMCRVLLKEFPHSEVIKDVGRQAFENILEESDRPKRVPLAEVYINDFPGHPMAETAYKIILSYYWKDAPDKEKVRAFANRWVSQSPNSPAALRLSARLVNEMDIEPDSAVRWAAQCVKLVRQSSGSPAAQTAWYDEWQCDNDVRLFEALDTLGWAYFKKADYANAEKYLAEALSEFNFDSRTWYHLGKLAEEQGKPMPAILDCYARSLTCRDNIKELPDAVKDLYKKAYPELAEDMLEPLFKNLNKSFADAEGLPYFTDITAESGLDKAGGRRLAWGDYNNDGLQDIMIGGCALWRNKGNGAFEDVTDKAGISGDYSGGVWADYNNDGWLDFFSSGWDDALWRNNGDGSFTNVTAEVNHKLSDGYPTEGAGWGDYNRDGFVDLYTANYENPFAVGTPDFLWQNIRGKEFKDVTTEARVIPSKNRCGRGVSWADYNNDGWPDIFVSNYRLNPDFLWRNNRDGTFTNAAKDTGVEGFPAKGYYAHTIGADWADYDNDGNLDLFQANLAHPRYITFSNMSLLLKNSGPPDFKFVEQRKDSGIRFEETHSDPAWVDFDNDGLLDLYVTSVYPERPSFLYKQERNGKFRDVTWLTGTRVGDGWGCAWADIDNDGDMDLIVSGVSRGPGKGNIYLFRNEAISGGAGRNNFLEVRLVGKDCNRSAIGARITLTLGKKKYIREVKGGRGTTSQDSLVQHFGLGGYNKEIGILIRWPCGDYSGSFNVVKPNQIITIEE